MIHRCFPFMHLPASSGLVRFKLVDVGERLSPLLHLHLGARGDPRVRHAFPSRQTLSGGPEDLPGELNYIILKSNSLMPLAALYVRVR